MKKVILLIICFLMIGCDERVESIKSNQSVPMIEHVSGGLVTIRTYTINGHDYVWFDGTYAGCALHSASCKCRDMLN